MARNNETAIAAFKGVINTKEIVKRMTTALGSKDKAGQFMASMLDLYEGDPYLQNCDPEKVAAECFKAASLNLPIVKGLGFAYVVPYKNTATFIVGYRGLIQLALRSGQYRHLNADCIYEGEEIIYNRLSGQFEIAGQATSDKAVGYFAYFQLINGFEKSFYMSVDDIKAYAKKYSKAYNNGPWKTEFDAMAKKTVLRQILKYGPMSTEMQTAEAYEVQAAETAAQDTVNNNAYKDVIDLDDDAPADDGAAADIEVTDNEVTLETLEAAQQADEAAPADPEF